MSSNSDRPTRSQHPDQPHADTRLPYFKSPRDLSNFWQLPKELQERIISLACSDPLPRSTVVGRSSDCTQTMLALLKTSKFFFVNTIPLLYRHVRINRPSILAAFHGSLAGRPSLAQLVKSLHVGPDEVPPGDWYPFFLNDKGHLVFRLHLDGEGHHDHQWDPFAQSADASMQALQAALESAASTLDVSLRRDDCDASGADIGSDSCHVRTSELRAALEIYYTATRQYGKDGQPGTRESKRKRKSSPDVPLSYPRLVVETGTKVSSSSHGRDHVLRVTRSQILARLARPGSLTDTFSHPLLFARSNLPWRAEDLDKDTYEGGLENNEIFGAEEIPDAFCPPDYSWTENEVSSTYDDPWELYGLRPHNTATVGANVALARSILSFTLDLHCLSLTGIFERLLVGGRPATHNFLSSATIGPGPPGWYADLKLNHPTFRCLEKLRLCDVYILENEIPNLTGDSGALPRLKRLQWSMVQEYSPTEPQSIVKIVHQLVGLQHPSATASDSPSEAPTQGRKSNRQTCEDEKDSASSNHEGSEEGHNAEGVPRRTILIELLLHPSDVHAILASAPTAEVAEAWQTGEGLQCMRHRTKISAHPLASIAQEPEGPDEESTQAQYDFGRKWWEEGW